MSVNTVTEEDAEQPKGLLGMVERLGNKVPPPALMFAASRNVFAHLIELTQQNMVRPIGALHPETVFERI